MSKKVKKFISLILTGALAAACLAGCGGKKAQPEEDDTKAMGRYLETDVALPENTTMAYDMVQAEDGTIRVSAMDEEENVAVWKLSEDETSWEKLYDFEKENTTYENYSVPYVSSLTLSPNGDALAKIFLTNPEDETGEDYKIKYFYTDSSGAMSEVPYESENFSMYVQSAPDGKFYFIEGDFSVRRLDVENGEAQIIVDSDSEPRFFGIGGKTLYSILKNGEIASYDLEKDEPLPQDEGLNESFKQNSVDTSSHSSESMPVIFTGGADDDTMFYCSNAGVFRHVKNGNVAEKVIDGALTSLSSPDMGFMSMEVTEDESIYVLAQGTEGTQLMKYTYSADTPAVPEKEIKTYSLYENPELLQAISVYQKENPEVYVSHEVGVAKDSGITASDALRTLSTEIMAGNGPDLLLLDGMPLDSYIEKGMLDDISDIISEVDKGEGLFTNIASSFEKDGKVCAVPLRFHMPVLEGRKESLANVKDLETLVEESERLHEENPDKPVINAYLDGVSLAAQLYDACSAAWVQDDGTIDESKLKEFYTQIKKLYEIDERSGEGYERGTTFAESVSSIGAGMMDMYADKNNINFGSISTIHDLAQLMATLSDKQNIGYDVLNGQSENTFLPGCIAGINSQGKELDAARDFLKFLLGGTAQSMNQGNGMPVNRTGMEELVLNTSFDNYIISVSMAGESDSSIEMTLKDITEEEYQSYLEKVEKLETPSLSNVIIRDAVLEQMNDCVTGAVSPEDAVKKVVEKINLYLAEG